MRSLLLTILFCCSLSATGQFHSPPVVNYSSHDYGRNENPETYSVVQDNRGVMYFGTGHNVIEFDGKKWKIIRIQQGTFIQALAVDSSGVVYVGGNGDFGYLTPDQNGELMFKSLKPKLAAEDQYFTTIWRIFTNKTSVFFQSQEAFFEYEIESKKIWTIYPDNSYHLSFMVDGEFYVRERDVGLVKYEDDAPVPLPGTDPFRMYGVFGLHKLPDDSLLIVTQELGLYKWKDGSLRQLPEVNDKPLADYRIWGSQQLSDGNFALNTYTTGVIVIDPTGKIVSTISGNSGLRSNDVKAVYEDRDLNLWLALGNGIAKVNYNSPLSYFDAQNGVDGNVEAMIRFKGQLYVGTSFGLYIQNNDISSNKKFIPTNIPIGNVWDLKIVGDALLAGTQKGILVSSDGINFREAVRLEGTNVLLHHPGLDMLVAGCKSGIYVYDRAFHLLWSYPNPDPNSSFLTAVIDPNAKNTIWLGSTNNGIFRLEIDQGFHLTIYDDLDGLPDDKLGTPILYDDRVLFGTNQGLLSFITEDQMVADLADSLKDNPDYYRGMFQVEPLHDSVFSHAIWLLADREDRTWYCHQHDLGYYDKKSERFIQKPFQGIDHGRINEFYLEENGVLWVGSADGLIRYETNKMKRYHGKFNALIRKVVVGRDSLLFSGSYADKNGIPLFAQESQHTFELPFELNQMTFQFAAPYYEDYHDVIFSYKLEGLSEQWSPWAPKSEATFTNLSEGNYTFVVKARNIFGHESELARYKFSIQPPWYRTTWAYIMYGLGFILILFIGVRISSARLKAKNAWLEGVVAERTSEIQQKNVVLQHQKEEIQDSINYAQRIQQAILPLQEEMKEWMPNSFVLFRPKDIVSGDFYWFQEKNGKLVMVCADCTGHGVPGAFMSMLGSNGLSNIVTERGITSPSEILANLNVGIKKSLKQDGHKGATRDGMDASICTVDLKRNVMYFSGANRPLWIVAEDGIREVSATKVAIAGFTPDDQVYDQHEIALTENMKFYLTTDGYADQFGGEREKKYKVKSMKDFILKNCGKSFDQQRQMLEQELIAWMGGIEQVDDVCVIGFEPFLKQKPTV